MEQERTATTAGAPVRVVDLEIPSPALSERLLGPDLRVARCRVIFRNMLPVPESAVLQAVTAHGLTLVFPAAVEGEHGGLMVPWSELSYVKLPGPTTGKPVRV